VKWSSLPGARQTGLVRAVYRHGAASFSYPLVSSRTLLSILADFRHDLVWFLSSYSSSDYSIFVPENSQITKAMEIVMSALKTLAW